MSKPELIEHRECDILAVYPVSCCDFGDDNRDSVSYTEGLT